MKPPLNSEPAPLRFVCRKEATLIDFLLSSYGSSATRIKKLASNGLLKVNGELVKNMQTPLHNGDEVLLSLREKPSKNSAEYTTLFEDEYLLAVSKPAGFLTVSDHQGNPNLFNQLKKAYKNNIFVCHRLDREVSGVVLFAKTLALQKEIENNWRDYQKIYRAKAEGHFQTPEEKLVHYLKTQGPYQVFVLDHPSADSAEIITAYKVLKQYKNEAELEIRIYTGKKNQIRAQLAHVGHPIVGDTKFGSQIKSNRIALHSYQLILKHPVTGQDLSVTAPVSF